MFSICWLVGWFICQSVNEIIQKVVDRFEISVLNSLYDFAQLWSISEISAELCELCQKDGVIITEPWTFVVLLFREIYFQRLQRSRQICRVLLYKTKCTSQGVAVSFKIKQGRWAVIMFLYEERRNFAVELYFIYASNCACSAHLRSSILDVFFPAWL